MDSLHESHIPHTQGHRDTFNMKWSEDERRTESQTISYHVKWLRHFQRLESKRNRNPCITYAISLPTIGFRWCFPLNHDTCYDFNRWVTATQTHGHVKKCQFVELSKYLPRVTCWLFNISTNCQIDSPKPTTIQCDFFGEFSEVNNDDVCAWIVSNFDIVVVFTHFEWHSNKCNWIGCFSSDFRTLTHAANRREHVVSGRECVCVIALHKCHVRCMCRQQVIFEIQKLSDCQCQPNQPSQESYHITSQYQYRISFVRIIFHNFSREKVERMTTDLSSRGCWTEQPTIFRFHRHTFAEIGVALASACSNANNLPPNTTV